MINFRGITAAVAERLSDPDTLSSIAGTSYRIAGLSGFVTFANGLEDIREREQLSKGTKISLAGSVISFAVGTAALARSISSSEQVQAAN